MRRGVRVTWMAATAVCALWSLAGCASGDRAPVPADKMARVMADMNYADAMVGTQYHSTYSSDSVRKLLKQSILARHGVSQQELDSTLMWYGRHVDEYMELCERIDSIYADSLRAIDRQMELMAAASGHGADSFVSLWPERAWHVFSDRSASDFLTFSVEADSSWRRGDVFIWGMTMTDARSPLDMVMAVEYAERPGSLELMQSGGLTGSERHTLELRTDSLLTPVRVSGYAYLHAAQGEWALADSISLTRSPNSNAGYYRMRRQVETFPPMRPRR